MRIRGIIWDEVVGKRRLWERRRVHIYAGKIDLLVECEDMMTYTEKSGKARPEKRAILNT